MDGVCAILRLSPAERACYVEAPLGRIAGLRRFTSLQRFVPFWLRPAVGTREDEVKPETLWLLARLDDGAHLLLAPLLGRSARYSLLGSADGLVVAAETGDPAVVVPEEAALFVALGHDPYELIERSARAVAAHHSARLRREKPLPDTVDLFGWCTWDAFYKEVSPEKVLAGLDAFARAGVSPKWLILDDGWQSTEPAPSGEERLVGLRPNARFGGDLGPLVREAKERFGVRRFLVWHAFAGYWGGVCPCSLPGYESVPVARSFGPGVLRQEPDWNVRPWGARIAVPSAEGIARFYADYHDALLTQGVDGVKVDAQAMLEAVAAGSGGRVALHRAYRAALDASAARRFEGRLINCMGATTECAYLADSAVFRSSDDFFPSKPESHGAHLFANAQVSLWFGEFMLPDWDMFQSAHPRGAFHAAARAISGGPVYVSDKPGAHDAELLRKLVLSDGTVLRADRPARPSPECLFSDPSRERVALKIFNMNRECGVLGVFNLHADGAPIACNITTGDIPLLQGEDYAVFFHRTRRLTRMGGAASLQVSIEPGEWEIVSFSPIARGFAPVGLTDKFNSTGAILSRNRSEAGGCRIRLRDGGHFLAWCESKPELVTWNAQPAEHWLEADTCRLEVSVPFSGEGDLHVQWTSFGKANP